MNNHDRNMIIALLGYIILMLVLIVGFKVSNPGWWGSIYWICVLIIQIRSNYKKQVIYIKIKDE